MLNTGGLLICRDGYLLEIPPRVLRHNVGIGVGIVGV